MSDSHRDRRSHRRKAWAKNGEKEHAKREERRANRTRRGTEEGYRAAGKGAR